MYQEKKEEYDLPVVKTALTHQYYGSKITKKKRGEVLIKAARQEEDQRNDNN